MNYREIMLSSTDYIEQNLKVDLTVRLLAKRANFSPYHYYRLFTFYLGMPVMEYVRLEDSPMRLRSFPRIKGSLISPSSTASKPTTASRRLSGKPTAFLRRNIANGSARTGRCWQIPLPESRPGRDRISRLQNREEKRILCRRIHSSNRNQPCQREQDARTVERIPGI